MKGGMRRRHARPALLITAALLLFVLIVRASDKKVDVSKIHGRIQFVNSFPDYKVQAVTSFADLHVQIVDLHAGR